MRPTKLTMSAFGPYAEVETIDFTELKEQNIFVITGPTGAGKTTIFDGICYAIFGAASGADRDGDNLRSDFADDDAMTYVELEFELKGRSYYIKRVPRQKRPKVRGEGFAEQKADAEFRTSGGKTISGVKEVNEQIERILGITYEQFKQIVMIPQGEFRELLLSESKDREVIFRKIFGTWEFQRIQELLDQNARELSKSIEMLAERRKTYIKNIDCSEDIILKEMTSKDSLNIKEICEKLDLNIGQDEKLEISLEQERNLLDKELECIQKSLLQGQVQNKKFVEAEEAERGLETLKNKKTEIEEAEKKLHKGRKALSIKGSEDYFTNRQSNLQNKVNEQKESKDLLLFLGKDLEASRVSLEIEEKKADERKNLSEILISLRKSIDKVTDYETRKLKIARLKHELKLREELKQSSQKNIEELKLKIKSSGESLDTARRAAVNHAEKASLLSKEEDIYNKLNELNNENIELNAIRAKYVGIYKKYKSCEKEYMEQKALYDHQNELFLKGQAGVLAKALTPDMPCPVCGSKHHPSPAEAVEGVLTEEELKKERLRLEGLEKEFHEAYQSKVKIEEQGRSRGQ